MRLKLGDHVRIKGKDWYGHRKHWIVGHIFKNGDIMLRNAHDENETLERYSPDDLKREKL